MLTKEVSWGDGLVLATFRHPGGLKAAVDAITSELGPVGSRNTFAKLLRVETPESLGPRDRWRAWLLLVALRQEPSEWGISDDVVPRAVNEKQLRRRLTADMYFHGNEFSHTGAAETDSKTAPAGAHRFDLAS